MMATLSSSSGENEEGERIGHFSDSAPKSVKQLSYRSRGSQGESERYEDRTRVVSARFVVGRVAYSNVCFNLSKHSSLLDSMDAMNDANDLDFEMNAEAKDDEATIDAEEALQKGVNPSEEIDALEGEADADLHEVLRAQGIDPKTYFGDQSDYKNDDEGDSSDAEEPVVRGEPVNTFPNALNFNSNHKKDSREMVSLVAGRCS